MQKKNHSQQDYNAYLKTPFASLGLKFHGDALSCIDFLETAPGADRVGKESEQVCKQILDYCSSHPEKKFELALDVQGTDFQKKVWSALQKIPAGTVLTYGELARRLNTSPRAVGNACRSNPVPVVIPCHRVVGKTGLGGFAGDTDGRLVRIKKWLLEHEGVHIS